MGDDTKQATSYAYMPQEPNLNALAIQTVEQARIAWGNGQGDDAFNLLAEAIIQLAGGGGNRAF